MDLSARAPPARYAFCAVVKSAPDASSHQIYMFSGIEANLSSSGSGVVSGPTAQSIWVLTIPTFDWIPLDSSGDDAKGPGGRIAPACSTIGEHFVLSYGGRKTQGLPFDVECDDKANAAYLFDLNTLSWTDQFEPNQGTYEVPKKVYDVIGGK